MLVEKFNLQSLDTWQVVEELVKPATRSSQVNFVESLLNGSIQLSNLSRKHKPYLGTVEDAQALASSLCDEVSLQHTFNNFEDRGYSFSFSSSWSCYYTLS